MSGYRFVKGHGTENDFVLLPDHDGSGHGNLGDAEGVARVRALCDRRAGIGGDGVLRVVRSAVADPRQADEAEWFMDYRNSDGSVSEMCGNGIRVFAEHLRAEGLVRPGVPVPVGTRDGVKTLLPEGPGRWTVDLGVAEDRGATEVRVGERRWPAVHVSTGNPHAVVFVDDLADAGPLLEEPGYDRGVYPDGVNVEFVVRRGPRHVAMRVHERGSGETRSCGTGAAAVAFAVAQQPATQQPVTQQPATQQPGSGQPGTQQPDGAEATYTVDVPGGTLQVTCGPGGRVRLTGPAVLVASGVTDL